MERELLAAELCFAPVNTADATKDIDKQLSALNSQIDKFTLSVSRTDYAAAIASGLLSGAIDAFLVGQTTFLGPEKEPLSRQIKDVGQKLWKEYNRYDTQDKTVFHSAVTPASIDLLPHLVKMTSSASPLGLVASVLVQVMKSGMLDIGHDHKPHLLTKELKGNNLPNEYIATLCVIAVIVGTLKWLSSTSKDDPAIGEKSHFKVLDRIRELIRSAPAFNNYVSRIEKWQQQLPKEISEFRSNGKSDKSGSTVEQIFYSFFMMLSTAPAFPDKNLRKVMHVFREANRLDLKSVPIIESLTRQAFPVLINEILVRTFYFASRLAKELASTENNEEIDWEKVLPFGNRNVKRLIMVSSVTLNVADTADAAIRAALDSRGDFIIFALKFVTRFNFVASGRALVAIISEWSDEKLQMELIHEKRLLTEEKTEKALAILEEYQTQLEARLSEYLADDIGSFLEGIDKMDQGLMTGDSDRVIEGNVIIQRVLGREVQFTNQKEFDDLMNSDELLRL